MNIETGSLNESNKQFRVSETTKLREEHKFSEIHVKFTQKLPKATDEKDELKTLSPSRLWGHGIH